MNDYKTIGTSAICNINELAEWLESDYGHNYLIYNWSPANQEYWNKGEKINFYNLQQVIPGFLQIDDFYRNLNHWKISSLIEEYEYMQVIQQKYDLLYLTDNFAVIRNANKVYLFPEKFLINERFCDYDHISISKLKVLKGTSELPGLIPASKSNVTMHDMKSLMDEKHREIAAAEEQIEKISGAFS